MRVVSFNIHHGTVGRRGPVDPERLGAVCAAFDADVIGLQEVDQSTARVGGADLAAVVASACGMDHVFGPSKLLPGGRYGNALLVRGELISHEVMQLPRTPRWRVWQERRTVLWAAARLTSGLELDLAVTHLAVPKPVNGPQLEVLLGRIEGHTSPLVVVGDFNRMSGAVRPQAQAAGLQFAEHGPTFPAGAPRQAIDHVLASRHFAVRHAEVRSTEMSDHAALIVDLDPDPAAGR